MALASIARSTGTRLKDAVRHSRLAQAAAFARSICPNLLDLNQTRQAKRVLNAYRLTFRTYWVNVLAKHLDLVRALPEDEVLRTTQATWKWSVSETPLNRSLILKAPGPHGERGVMIIFPEYNWLRLAADAGAMTHVTDRYTLLLSAGWSPLDYALLELMARRSSGQVFIQACNRAEFKKIEAFHPNLKCLPTLGSDWINPDLYRPRPRDQRKVDLVMVANWGPFKRHWHLFDALRELPETLRVRLIGQPDGTHKLDRIQQQARDCGVRQHLEFFESLPIDQVQEHLSEAHISVILSRHEGYCGAVTESMFADTPVGLLQDAFIGSKDYINPRTGVLLPHRGLGRALSEFLARAGEFRPRDWAVEHISCHRSLEKLSGVLREHALREGRPWTVDIAPFCWRPLATLIRGTDAVRLSAAADELSSRFPSLFDRGMVNSLPESSVPT